MRHGLGAEWASYTTREIEELEWILGEIWAYVSHGEWDELHFGKLTGHDVIKVLGLATQIRQHTRDTVAILQDVIALVKVRG